MTYPRDHIGGEYKVEDYSPLSIVVVSVVMITAAMISVSMIL